MIDLLVVLGVVGASTLAIALTPARKEPAALVGATLVMVWGQVRGFFSADQAFASISMPVLAILLAIGVFAEVFSDSGIFERICRRLAVLARARRTALVLLFLLLTYAASCLLNNLTCLMVLLPIMIGALRAVGMSPAGMQASVSAIVIASNLGGASTMIGDFPNILIARSQGIPFVDFLEWMLPACVVLLGVLAVLAAPWRGGAPASPASRELLVEMIDQQAAASPVDWRLLGPATVTFAFFLAGITATGWVRFPPEIAAMAFACLCVWCLPRPQDWLARVDVRSILFLSCLFIFAGAVQATGALDRAAAIVLDSTAGDPYRLSASVILLACLLTAVFSAGPTTAALIPVAGAMKGALPGHLIWWCLSLGVLAGSSATMLSATAGPVAANLLRAKTGLELGFVDFWRIGWKSAASFAVLSVLYVWGRLWTGI